MAVELGELYVELGARTAGLRRDQAQAKTILSGIQGDMSKTRSLARDLAGTLGVVGAGFSLAVPIREFAAFDDKLNQSIAIMGSVDDVMRGRMATAAREMAKSTRIGAAQAAEGFYFLASSGLTAEESIKALPVAARFATAGLFDMAKSTELLADAQNALGLAIRGDAVANMENMIRVSDVLVKGNIIANASVEQLADAITNKAAGALRNLSKDIEEGVAVLSAFAAQGLKGKHAGEALSIVLRDLSTKAISNKKAFEDAKVTVFDASGKMRNMADIVQDLEGALSGLSDEQKQVTLTNLGFQAEAVGYIKNLMGMSTQIRTYEKDLRAAGGATQEVADKQMKSFTAQMTVAVAKMKDAGITIGSELAPTILDLASVAASGAEALGRIGPAIDVMVKAGLLYGAIKLNVMIANTAAAAGVAVSAFFRESQALFALTAVQRAAMAAEQARATATLLAAQADMQAAAAAAQHARSEAILATSAEASAAALNAVAAADARLVVAQQAATAAAVAQGSAMGAAGVAAAGAGANMTVFGRSMMLLGGPAGLVMILATSLTYLTKVMNDNAKAALDVQDALDAAYNARERGRENGTTTQDQAQADIDRMKAERAKAQAELDAASQAQEPRFAGGIMITPDATAMGVGNVEKLKRAIQDYDNEIHKAEATLASLPKTAAEAQANAAKAAGDSQGFTSLTEDVDKLILKMKQEQQEQELILAGRKDEIVVLRGKAELQEQIQAYADKNSVSVEEAAEALKTQSAEYLKILQTVSEGEAAITAMEAAQSKAKEVAREAAQESEHHQSELKKLVADNQTAQERYNAAIERLNELKPEIGMETYTRAVAKARKELEQATGAFTRYLADLETEKAILAALADGNKEKAEALKDEEAIRRAVAGATAEQTAQLLLLMKESRDYQSTIEENNRLDQEAVRIKEALLTPAQQVEAQQKLINDVYAAGKISAEEYHAALLKIQMENSVLIELGREFGDSMSQALEDVVLGSSTAGEALDGLIKEIERLALRALILKPLEDALGRIATSMLGGMMGGGGAAGGGGGGGINWLGLAGTAIGGFFGGPAGAAAGGAIGGAAGGAGGNPLEFGPRPAARGAWAATPNPDDLIGAPPQSGVNVTIIDKREAGSPNVEEKRSTGKNGQQQVTYTIHKTIQDGMDQGLYDGAMRRNFNSNRRVRGRT